MNKGLIKLLFFLLLAAAPLLLGTSELRSYGWLLILFYAMLGINIQGVRGFPSSYLSLGSLLFNYTAIWITIGAWGYSWGFISEGQDYYSYLGWTNMGLATFAVLFFLAPFPLISRHFQIRSAYYVNCIHTDSWSDSYQVKAAILLSPVTLISISLEFVGASGDLSWPAKALIGILMILYVQNKRLIFRLGLYVLIIGGLALVSISNKREAIFLLAPMLYLESLRLKKIWDWRFGIIVILLGFVSVFLILAMSIARGYGSFGGLGGNLSLIQSLNYVEEYISQDEFVANVLYNFEFNRFYFHALNSVDMVLEDTSKLLAGSTIIKPLFAFIPRDIAPWKPDSMIHVYTSLYDPVYRATGGSWPITFVSELFFNFWFFGFFFAVAFATILGFANMKFLKLLAKTSRSPIDQLKIVFFLYAYLNILNLARGSGLDQYFIYLFLGLVFLTWAYFLSLAFKLAR